MKGTAEPPHAALFHNNHDGTFTDVASKAGVTNGRWGFGVAVGDYNNDGWPDLYVSNYGKNSCTTTTMTAPLPMLRKRLE